MCPLLTFFLDLREGKAQYFKILKGVPLWHTTLTLHISHGSCGGHQQWLRCRLALGPWVREYRNNPNSNLDCATYQHLGGLSRQTEPIGPHRAWHDLTCVEHNVWRLNHESMACSVLFDVDWIWLECIGHMSGLTMLWTVWDIFQKIDEQNRGHSLNFLFSDSRWLCTSDPRDPRNSVKEAEMKLSQCEVLGFRE